MTLPAGEKITTISDSGTPYYTGIANSNGIGWYSSTYQGYMGFPTARQGCPASSYGTRNGSNNTYGPQCAPASSVTYQEAFMADAWGTQWTLYASYLYPNNLSLGTPPGSPGPFMTMAGVTYVEMFGPTPSGYSPGDTFHIIDSNNDFLAPWFFNMYPNGTMGQTATVASGQSQLINTFAFGNNFHQVITNESGFGTFAGSQACSLHHDVLLNDVATWDSNATQSSGHGSCVLQWLNVLGL
jgi:hypothetical protein